MTRIVLDPRNLPKGKTDWKAFRDMSDREVMEAARSDPDARPLSPMQIERLLPAVNVKALRKNLGMTQLEFCKTFKLSVGTVRDWEQRRFVPEGPTHVLLTIIDRNPDAVIQVLQEKNEQETAKPRGVASVKKQPRKPGAPKYRRKSAAA